MIIKAKDGYSNVDKISKEALTIEFTIDRGSIKEVELNTDGKQFYNYQTLLEIRKKGIDGESGLSGATFLLKGNTVSEEGETISEPLLLETDAEEKIILKGQLIGGQKYTLEEKTAPADYEKIQQILTFRMKENGEVEVVSGQAETDSQPGYMLTASGISENVLTVRDEPIEVKIANEEQEKAAVKGAKTGDVSHYGEYLLWTILSGLVLVFAIRRKRKS